MSDLVKRLRELSSEARNDFANDWFDAEETGERPDLMQITVEVSVEFAESVADRIEELEVALDAGDKEAGLSDNGSMWRFWAEKARVASEQAAADRRISKKVSNDVVKWKRRAEAAEAKLATIDMDVLARVEAKLSAVLEACDRAKMHPRPGCGAGGMTIEANIRGSVYSGVDAWPVEEARDAHDDFRAMMEKLG